MTVALCLIAAFFWAVTVATRAWANETADKAMTIFGDMEASGVADPLAIAEMYRLKQNACAQAGFASGIVIGAVLLTLLAIWSFLR